MSLGIQPGLQCEFLKEKKTEKQNELSDKRKLEQNLVEIFSFGQLVLVATIA